MMTVCDVTCGLRSVCAKCTKVRNSGWAAYDRTLRANSFRIPRIFLRYAQISHIKHKNGASGKDMDIVALPFVLPAHLRWSALWYQLAIDFTTRLCETSLCEI